MISKLEQLIQLYRESAVAHGEFILAGNHREANKSHDRIINTLQRIRLNEDEGDAALLALTEDQNLSVACWAATHSLKKHETLSRNTLEKIAQTKGPIGFTAKMVIQQWNKGTLNLI